MEGNFEVFFTLLCKAVKGDKSAKYSLVGNLSNNGYSSTLNPVTVIFLVLLGWVLQDHFTMKHRNVTINTAVDILLRKKRERKLVKMVALFLYY